VRVVEHERDERRAAGGVHAGDVEAEDRAHGVDRVQRQVHQLAQR
jgi:hypothetical protein